MAWRRFLTPIIGNGSIDDPYRAKYYDSGFVARHFIASKPDGHPRLPWALVLIDAGEKVCEAIDADPELVHLPEASLDSRFGDIPAASRTRMQAEILDRGIQVAPDDKYGAVLLRVTHELEPAAGAADLEPAISARITK